MFVTYNDFKTLSILIKFQDKYIEFKIMRFELTFNVKLFQNKKKFELSEKWNDDTPQLTNTPISTKQTILQEDKKLFCIHRLLKCIKWDHVRETSDESSRSQEGVSSKAAYLWNKLYNFFQLVSYLFDLLCRRGGNQVTFLVNWLFAFESWASNLSSIKTTFYPFSAVCGSWPLSRLWVPMSLYSISPIQGKNRESEDRTEDLRKLIPIESE